MNSVESALGGTSDQGRMVVRQLKICCSRPSSTTHVPTRKNLTGDKFICHGCGVKGHSSKCCEDKVECIICKKISYF